MKLGRLLAVGVVIGVVGWWWLGPRAPLPAATPPVARDASPSAWVAPSRAAPAALATAGSPPASGSGPVEPAPVAPVAPVAPAAASADGRLLLPVQGVGPDQLQDTFTDARSEGRVHDAIDILAPAGTPVLAVADGTVEKLFSSERGGLTVYQFEPGGRYCYYYAHLERYAEGLAEKQVIRRGQVIGYVGSTGNASPDAPHLHFEIHRLGPEKHWWQGESLNPYPLLRGEQPLP
ncbi:M23 family metallopeptidase [Stenotrophomonas sp.]|uniref:M23 family metallopeptidase n=1 Tax=Stenotrophomonas sp. TaxID=69392 RepID=UPI002FCB56F9